MCVCLSRVCFCLFSARGAGLFLGLFVGMYMCARPAYVRMLLIEKPFFSARGYLYVVVGVGGLHVCERPFVALSFVFV
jgi:hypothetical protein